jgi:hypothetical protein
VIFAGAVMGLCFAFMWVTTMYQLWFSATPPAVAHREDRDATVVG